jgi:hypothetical protein
MANIWFETNKRQIEAVKRQLIEYNYAGSYGGSINLMQVNNIIDGMIIEITKMDKEILNLKKEILDLQKQMIPEEHEKSE